MSETAEISKSQVSLEIIAKKKEAWATMGEAIHTAELQLQAKAQRAIAEIKIPTTIAEIPAAESTLKLVKAKALEIEEERKKITNRFRDVADRLMVPEKSFAEPLKKLTDAIVGLKKIHEADQNKEANKNREIALLKERIIKHCADLDAKLKLFINDMIDKAFVKALNDSIPIIGINAKIKEWSDLGIKRLLEYKFEKFDSKPVNITQEEATKICSENWTINLIDYANTFDFSIKEKFKDYEVAFHNKADALAKNQVEKQEAEKAIADQKLNAEISASINAAAAPLNATPIIDTKELKKTYEIDMSETPETVLMLFAAYAANRAKVEAELRVTKWFSLNASQVANALGKIKSKDNTFAFGTLVFKETVKL